MSLNNITNYNELFSATTDVYLSDVVFENDLNINMSTANVGDVLAVDDNSDIVWIAINELEGASIEHAVIEFKELTINTPEAPNPAEIIMKMNVLIPDASGKITIEGGVDNDLYIKIDNTVKGTFIAYVNYVVDVPDNEQCYQFKTEFKVALNNDDPTTGFDANSNIGLCTTILSKDLLTDPYFNVDNIEQSTTTVFTFGTYTEGLNNTYIRTRVKKLSPTMQDADIDANYSTITIVRLT